MAGMRAYSELALHLLEPIRDALELYNCSCGQSLSMWSNLSAYRQVAIFVFIAIFHSCQCPPEPTAALYASCIVGPYSARSLSVQVGRLEVKP
jgi:hypothetical protein